MSVVGFEPFHYFAGLADKGPTDTDDPPQAKAHKQVIFFQSSGL